MVTNICDLLHKKLYIEQGFSETSTRKVFHKIYCVFCHIRHMIYEQFISCSQPIKAMHS